MNMKFKSQISGFQWALAAFTAVVLSSCGGAIQNNEPSFRLGDLQGLWLQDKDTTEHYVRFTEEKADEQGYFLGREWSEFHGGDEAVYEKDLFTRYQVDTVWNIDEQTQDTISFTLDSTLLHGNGWFKYQLETKGDLHEIHLMDNDGAVIPKEYIVAVLTDEKLEYYEKDYTSRRFYFTRVVTKKTLNK